ncbi:hypothetical protein O0L34_g9454 [Tuta absoluta]|nr:hypothetical protein O0L34_g9454 [Tuta absoluta]
MAVFNLAVIIVFISMAHAHGFRQDPWGQLRMPRLFAPLPFPPFRPFPPSAIQVPSPDQIASIRPGPNQYFNGIAVQSSSSYSRDADGKVIKTGGSTIMTNENGRVNVRTVGDNPPGVNRVIVPPTGQNRYQYLSGEGRYS